MNGSYLDASSNGDENGYATISTTSSPISSHSSARVNGFIEHRVSKMDTLAGIAIKYGVEVADIRRMNGLVSDLQMFAHKTLQIPPGRHPPSPVIYSNGSATNGEHTPPRKLHDDVLDSLQSLKLKPPRNVSPAMNSLQGYYGLPRPKSGSIIEGTEMSLYKTARVLNMEDGLPPRESASEPGFRLHRKSRSLVSLENGDVSTEIAESSDGSEVDKSDKYIRRRQKGENDTKATNVLLKEDSGGGFFGRIGRGLALRPKIGSKNENDTGRQSSLSVTDFMSEVFVSVRKSSSTSSLQESEGPSSSSIWPTGKWSDAIARPIFDGLPKPMTGRRNKTALD